MRNFIVAVGFCVAFSPLSRASTLWDFLFPRPELQVITVTEMMPPGLLRRTPSPAQPMYYVAISGGSHDFGGTKAGERPVDPAVVTRTMQKVLAKQGYLPASSRHSPDIVLLWVWGTMNVDYWGISTGIPGLTQIQSNRGAMLAFMGGERVGLGRDALDPFTRDPLPVGLLRLTGVGDRISEAARDDLFVACVVAYDYNAATRQNRKEILWRTRISCPSRGYWMPEALPSMLAIAGPYLGRDTPQPVCIEAGDKFRPDIEMGEPRVLDYSSPAADGKSH